MNRWYENEFQNAVAKTTEWGLEIPGCDRKTDDEFDLITIRDNIHHFFNMKRWRFPYDLAGECIDRHMNVMGWVAHAIGLDTYLTIGEVFVNGKARYKASYELFQQELDDPAAGARTFDAHVWLTLPNYGILDVVLPASICGESIKTKGDPKLKYEDVVLHAGPESRGQSGRSTVRVPMNSKDGSFIYEDVYGKKRKLVYKPMLVGIDFLAKSDTAIQDSLSRLM